MGQRPCCCLCEQDARGEAASERYILVGSYTEKLGHVGSRRAPQAHGITVLCREPAESRDGFGSLGEHARMASAGANPSYMCANRARTLVYVVNESSYDGSLVTAYAFDAANGKMDAINAQHTGGAGACHVELSPDERHLAVANYTGGSIALFSVWDDGSVGGCVASHQYKRFSGVNAERQESPHPHMASFSKDGCYLLVSDLGNDVVLSYDVADILRKAMHGTVDNIDTCLEAILDLPDGSGPRHFVFHPCGQYAYVLNELLSTVLACKYDAYSGRLAAIDDPVSTVPEGTKVGVGGQSFAAAIRMSPDGRFVYVSNRGHCSIATFAVTSIGTLSPATFQLTSAGPESGPPAPQRKAELPPRDCPRDFALCGRQGQWLIVGNQDSDSLVVFDRDLGSGALSRTKATIPCPAPACILPLWQ